MAAGNRSFLHESFEVGIAIKGFDGLLEVLGGAIIFFMKPAEMNELVRKICEHLLARAPHSSVAIHMFNASQNMTSSSARFAALYLLSHGLVKILLVTCLWLNKLWAYPMTIGVFGAFAMYQVFRFTHTHSWALVVLTVFDVLIILLTWNEYRHQEAMRLRQGNTGKEKEA
jgi:uncharacterized membrane protein